MKQADRSPLGSDKDPFENLEFPLGVAEVCQITGVTPRKLQHYDQKGFVVPARTGEGVANNRKLYHREDLERLKNLLVLQAYEFTLEEAVEVLDGDEGAVFDILQDKINELQRRKNRLRNLVLFMKYVTESDTDLFDGLACGPADIDAAADWVRESPVYEAALERLDALLDADDPAEGPLFALARLMNDSCLVDDFNGFPAVRAHVELVLEWWDRNVEPLEDAGFLGFYAVIEDGWVGELMMDVAGESAPGDLQMTAFFTWALALMEQAGDEIARIAAEAETDVVGALERADGLMGLIGTMFAGSLSLGPTARGQIGEMVLGRLEAMARDKMLMAYLDPDRTLDVDPDALERVRQVTALLSPPPEDEPEAQRENPER